MRRTQLQGGLWIDGENIPAMCTTWTSMKRDRGSALAREFRLLCGEYYGAGRPHVQYSDLCPFYRILGALLHSIVDKRIS